MPIRWPNRIERAIALNFSFIALVTGALAIGIYRSQCRRGDAGFGRRLHRRAGGSKD
jgi:hypothetical protein